MGESGASRPFVRPGRKSGSSRDGLSIFPLARPKCQTLRLLRASYVMRLHKEGHMAIDRYTKAVLTVIAICLVWLSLGGPSLLPTVTAQGSDHVVVAGWVDETGRVRTLSGPPGGATALPVWMENR